MTAYIFYFGKVSTLTGKDKEQIDLPETITNISSLRQWVDSRFQAEGEFLDPKIRIAINGKILPDSSMLEQIDEIAFLPPVGGG
ncbi:MAG: MoaD/ThiS family protein [Pseudomonadota bacterium]